MLLPTRGNIEVPLMNRITATSPLPQACKLVENPYQHRGGFEPTACRLRHNALGESTRSLVLR